jgi:peptide-methionine (R)-S-oxide reductase
MIAKTQQGTTSASGYDITPLDAETIQRLAQDLNPEEYRILLDHGTEAPFCGTLLDNKLDGVYACRFADCRFFHRNISSIRERAGRRFTRHSIMTT